MLADTDILDGGKAVAVTFADGATRRFHAVWLRDNADDETTRASGNGQRLIRLGDIPSDTKVSHAEMKDGRLHLTFQPEDRTIAFDCGWLAENAYDRPASPVPGWTNSQIRTWDGTLGSNVPRADFCEVGRDRSALARWLAGVRRYGFGELEGGPASPRHF